MADRKHRCRRSCRTMVPDSMAFCRDCWRKVPARPKGLILRSWDRVRANKAGAYGAHLELLLLAEEALEGDRPWESVIEAAA